MKNKYGIGFLLFLILVVFGITCAYQLSLNKGKREIQAEINAKEQKEMNNTSVAADGQALKDDCYYLKELNGYVVVYLSDKKTVYEYTDISLEDLPENLQKEIQNGKYIETLESLYGFLENYSSYTCNLLKGQKIMDDKKVARINELYHKSKSEGLTPEELKEQQILRKEYIDSFKRNLRGQLNNISIKEKDGSITNLGEKFGNKKGN